MQPDQNQEPNPNLPQQAYNSSTQLANQTPRVGHSDDSTKVIQPLSLNLSTNPEPTASNTPSVVQPETPVVNTPLPVNNPQQQPSPYQTTQPQSPPKLGMFERRIGRLGFFLGIVYWAAILFIPIILQLLIRAVSRGSLSPNALTSLLNIISILSGIAGVILFIPIVISLYVRRLHDLDQSGLLTFLWLVPIVNFIFYLYLQFAPGNKNLNQYGPPIPSLNYWVVIGIKKPLNNS